MTRDRAGEHAPSDKSAGLAAILPERSADRASLSESRLVGAILSFEQVRGTGDAEVARLAELQHGHLHLRQLKRAGIGRGAVLHRVRTGRLHPTLPSVYLVGRPQRDVLGRMMAAALYFRGDALVTGQAAAQGWGLLDSTQQLEARDPIRVLLVGRNATPPEGIVICRTRSIARPDIRWRQGVPLTSPARTLLDLAGTMNDLELESALSAALRKNLVRPPQLVDVMRRNPRATGIGKLRALLEQGQSLHDTRSGYERKLLKLLEAAELPRPITNTWVAGKLVDALWPDLHLIVEFDGWQAHGERNGFENDRLRDQHLLIADHRVMRVTYRQIDYRPYALVARLASVITSLRMRQEATGALIAIGAAAARAG